MGSRIRTWLIVAVIWVLDAGSITNLIDARGQLGTLPTSTVIVLFGGLVIAIHPIVSFVRLLSPARFGRRQPLQVYGGGRVWRGDTFTGTVMHASELEEVTVTATTGTSGLPWLHTRRTPTTIVTLANPTAETTARLRGMSVDVTPGQWLSVVQIWRRRHPNRRNYVLVRNSSTKMTMTQGLDEVMWRLTTGFRSFNVFVLVVTLYLTGNVQLAVLLNHPDPQHPGAYFPLDPYALVGLIVGAPLAVLLAYVLPARLLARVRPSGIARLVRRLDETSAQQSMSGPPAPRLP